jgi:anaerobic selenocysteine-containing dehydrogenase
MSRRAALARLGLGAAAAPLAACAQPSWSPPSADPFSRALEKPHVPGAEKFATGEERWVKSACGQCAAACGVRVRVVEGRAVRVEGLSSNPINRGGIGPRGLASLQALYDPERIQGPLVRKNRVLVPITWEQALDLVASRLEELREHRTPHELLVLSGRERGFMHDLLDRFCRVFGTPNFVDGRPGQSGVLAQAMDACLGTFEVPVFDWSNARYVLSLETGLFEGSCQAVYLARMAAELRRAGGERARLVHAGPMFDLSAYNADEWLRLEPGTSGALALGLCHVLVQEGRHDLPFVTERALGFEGEDGFRAFVARFTPDEVSRMTGVSAADIVRLARELSARRPSFAVVDTRSLAYTSAWETALAVMSLNALLGNIGTPGGVLLAPAPPFRDWPAVEPDDIARAGLAAPRIDGAGVEPFPRARSIFETLPEAISAGAEPPIKVALLYHADPAHARQQPARWRQALNKIPLVVSFSPYRDQTVESVADLVLPDHSALESWEDAAATPVLPEAVVGMRQPVVDPLYDTRATGDVILDLARRLGGPVQSALPWHSFRAAMRERLLGLHQAQRGSIRADSERVFLETLQRDALWHELAPRPQVEVRFRFHSVHAMPEWQGQPAVFPLKLIAYRPLGHGEGGASMPWLHTLRSRPRVHTWTAYASVHPDTAGPGIATDDLIRVVSEWGAIIMRALVDARMMIGCVAVPLARDHSAHGHPERGLGANVMDIVRPGPAPRTGASLLCATRVRIEAARPEEV